MFIFIRNAAREYAWGDTGAIPAILGEPETGAPQAELWLGTHIDDPAELAHDAGAAETLLDLIQSDVDKYGVDGAGLPFLLKVLGIGKPLSLQAHPDKAQAVAGFDLEDASGVLRTAADRNYKDPNHKPEVVVALSDDFAALAGFRALNDVVAELRSVVSRVGEPAEPLADIADWLSAGDEGSVEQIRRDFLAWVFASEDDVRDALDALRRSRAAFTDEHRRRALEALFAEHPADPGILVSLLLHCVALRRGEALYVPPRNLHAYLSGVAIEVMASSDNVLRAGLTQKHVDVPELERVITFDELVDPRIAGVEVATAVTLWQPDVPDFSLRRVRLDREVDTATLSAEYPLVLICTEGKIIAQRTDDGLDEYANLARGQALYVSAGEPVTFTGNGELFVATVGEGWA